MRQLIMDLRVELPIIWLREIAEIRAVRFNRQPYHHTVQLVLASIPAPSITTRRLPLFNEKTDPATRRHNIVLLHAEGGSIFSIVEYLDTSRQTVYTTLKCWTKEGVMGLDDKSLARKTPRTVL